MVENRTYDQIAVGDSGSVTRKVTPDDLFLFARATGATNPLHLPGIDWNGDGRIDEPSSPALLVAAIVSAVVGNHLPGPGAAWRRLSLTFVRPVRLGETLTGTATVTAKNGDGSIDMALAVVDATGAAVLTGEGCVLAPTQRISVPHIEVPGVMIDRHPGFDRLIEAARGLPPLVTAVVQPDDAASIAGAIEAKAAGLIEPLMVGTTARMTAAAKAAGLDLSSLTLIEAADDEAAAAKAVALVGEGRAKALMKGHLHTDVLLHHVVKRDGGLRTARRISHVFVIDVLGRAAPLLISDAAINIAPDLPTKVDIVQNAIDLAIALGIATPRVGVLSAVETVNPAIPSTLDAAVLSKMAERGQIRGGIVDGPLAMDNAIDVAAARTKGITSLVAGRAEVLIVPNLEAGNMLAKELTFLASAEAAGLVIGARVPIMLTSRADSDKARLVSAALAVLKQHYDETGTSAVAPVDPQA